MKKVAALSLVLMFLFTGIGHAESKGVNLMEFARRYYHAMDIVGAKTVEPAIGDTPCVVFDGTVVYFDEAASVTKVFMLVSDDDENQALSMFSVLIALSTPYEDISMDHFNTSILDGGVCGDYELTSVTTMDSGMMMILELK